MSMLPFVSTYAGVFGLVMLSALVAPPGQEVAVLTEGRLVASGGLLWWPGFVVTVAAVVFSDLALFSIGRRLATFDRTPKWERVARLVRRIASVDAVAVVIARFVPGTRLLLFPAAGTGRIRVGRFLLLDTCAAALWVSSLLWAGARLMKTPVLASLTAWVASH